MTLWVYNLCRSTLPEKCCWPKIEAKSKEGRRGVDNGNGSDYYVWPFCFKYVSSTTALENIL